MLIEDQKLQNLLWLVWKQSYLKHVPFSDTKEHNEEARREKPYGSCLCFSFKRETEMDDGRF